MDSKKAMKAACQKVGVKEIAQAMGLSPTALYNQMNDPNKNDFLQRFVEFTALSNNDLPIHWACQQLNGMFVRNPKVVPDAEQETGQVVSSSLTEFADVIRVIGEAMHDGQITAREAEQIRTEWEEVKSLMESFVFACELGYLEVKETVEA